MSIESLTGLNKAAVLLICLGEEASAKIFDELSDEEVRKVTRAMAAIDHIPIDIKEKAISFFADAQQ
jgi:flagellar motor switch protein FliG